MAERKECIAQCDGGPMDKILFVHNMTTFPMTGGEYRFHAAEDETGADAVWTWHEEKTDASKNH